MTCNESDIAFVSRLPLMSSCVEHKREVEMWVASSSGRGNFG